MITCTLTARGKCYEHDCRVVLAGFGSLRLLPLPMMKFKRRGHRFDTVEEIQSASQMVLDTLKERDFQGSVLSVAGALGAVRL